ncbi:alpha/beta fold hydrolase [Anaerobacillus sp. MEB173]|uniref:alpha/beta fold hydrolase n=1 Tax=Anaerobacillus sp. MEB173 TaxID=3383345 RepID=UPI003F909AC0
MTMPYISVGNGEPIIFIHGLGNNKHLWDSQHELSSRYQLIIPDLRGHGENIDHTNITLPNVAADILELLNSLSIESATFCGLSMGGLVTLEVYKQAPDRVKSLILANTTAYCVPWLIHPNKYTNIRNQTIEQTKASIIERCLQKKDKAILQKTEKSFTIHREAFIQTAKHCSKANYSYILPFIHVPTLIINGVYDQITPPLLSYQLKWGIPHARLRTLYNGHLSNIENSQQFNKLIKEFMAGKALNEYNVLSSFFHKYIDHCFSYYRELQKVSYKWLTLGMK